MQVGNINKQMQKNSRLTL